jgi:hypothetical protein
MNNERLAQFKDRLKEFTKLDDEVADAINLLADIAQGKHKGWNLYMATIAKVEEEDEEGEFSDELEEAKQECNLYHTDNTILYEILKMEVMRHL